MILFEGKYRFVDYQGYRCSILWNFHSVEGKQVELAEGSVKAKVEAFITHMYGPSHEVECIRVESIRSGFASIRKSQVSVEGHY